MNFGVDIFHSLEVITTIMIHPFVKMNHQFVCKKGIRWEHKLSQTIYSLYKQLV